MNEMENFELSREDFKALPPRQQNLAIYDNIISIKKDIQYLKKGDSINSLKFTIGTIWLFLLTVYVGLKKYIPFF